MEQSNETKVIYDHEYVLKCIYKMRRLMRASSSNPYVVTNTLVLASSLVNLVALFEFRDIGKKGEPLEKIPIMVVPEYDEVWQYSQELRVMAYKLQNYASREKHHVYDAFVTILDMVNDYFPKKENDNA